MATDAEKFLQAGDLDSALTALQNQVRDDPSNSAFRIFLFQLLCVRGDWDRAITQMSVSSDLDEDAKLMAQAYREVIQCEVFREAVFRGEKQPLIFGEPPRWLADQIQALHCSVAGDNQLAYELALKVSESAPSVSGSIDGKAFSWITDGDMRLGPVIEAMINGKYYWVPIANIECIRVSEPTDLRDLVWAPVILTWKNEGESHGFIPSRYPLRTDDDSLARLARRTEWECGDSEFYSGIGQRMLATDTDDFPFLDCRQINFTTDAAAA